eukprot:259747-Prorocentrum_minimum.AAC.3
MSQKVGHLNGPLTVPGLIDWTRIPRTKLRRKDMLQSAISDAVVASEWICEKYPGVPLILGGFSFGGPTCWAAARYPIVPYSTSLRFLREKGTGTPACLFHPSPTSP